MTKRQTIKPTKKQINIKSEANTDITNATNVDLAKYFDIGNINTWLKKYFIWISCILILGWAGVRISYYKTVVNSPLKSMYLFDESDNKFFDDWAKALNKDWLNSKPMHPYHSWHKSYAEYYFSKHPEKLQEIQTKNITKDSTFNAGKQLWDEWYQGNQYHQEPLYPYMLAVFYYFNWDAVNAMLILQLLLGVLSGLLLLIFTRKYFGEVTAVLTGLMYLFCGILMYNEIILLRTSLSVFFTIFLVFMIDRLVSNQKPINFFLCGLAIGLSFLLQSTFILFLIGIFVILFFIRKQSLSIYFKNIALLILGFFLLFSPVIIRNKIVGAPLFSTSSVGPITFIASNTYGTNSISGWGVDAKRDAEIIANTNKSLAKSVVATLKTHPTISSYISLEWEKLKAVWKGVEYPNNENYYFYRQNVPVLQFTSLSFFLIAPLGFAGLIFLIYNRKKQWGLYLAILIQLITLLGFYVLARLRAPLVIVMLPLAGYAIVECFDFFTKKKVVLYSKIGIILVLILISYLGYTSKIEETIITDREYNSIYFIHFFKKLEKLKTNKEYDKWLDFQKDYFKLEPEFIKDIELNITTPKINLNRLQITKFITKVHNSRGGIYLACGDTINANKEFEVVKSLVEFIKKSNKELNLPEDESEKKDEIKELAKSYLEKGDYPNAIKYFELAKTTYAQDDFSYFNLVGTLYTKVKDFNKAIEYYDLALQFKPNLAEAHNGKAVCYEGLGNINEAINSYRIAIKADPKFALAYENLAGILFNQQKNDEAIKIYEKALILNPQNAKTYCNLGGAYSNLNKLDKAFKYLNKAIEMDPTYSLAYKFLGVTYQKSGDMQKANYYYSKAANVK